MSDFEWANREVSVTSSVIMWIAVIGNLILALKHPQNSGPTKRLILEFCSKLCTMLKEHVPEFSPEIINEWQKEIFDRLAEVGAGDWK